MCPAGMVADHIAHKCITAAECTGDKALYTGEGVQISTGTNCNCKPGFAPDASGQCAAYCPVGYTPEKSDGTTLPASPNTGKDCLKCGDNEIADHVNHKCIAAGGSCPSGTSRAANSLDCYCGDGRALTGTTCEDCTVRSDGKIYADHDLHQCVKYCGDGKVPDAAKNCYLCPLDQVADHILKQCVSKDTCTAANKKALYTADGTISDSGRNCNCKPGFAPNDAGVCTECSGATPYANHVSHKCEAYCPIGCTPMRSDGTTLPATPVTGKDCLKCGDNEIADHVNHQCIAAGGSCPSGTSTAKDSLDCYCGDGKALTGSTCEDCSLRNATDGKIYADHDLHKCVKYCGDGKTPDSAKNCELCPEGKIADHIAHQCVDPSACTAANNKARYTGEGVLSTTGKNCNCKPGFAPNDAGVCAECTGSTPYANHVEHKCAAYCPLGYTPKRSDGSTEPANAIAGTNGTDCLKCGFGEMADHVNHKCIAATIGACPSGTSKALDSNDCYCGDGQALTGTTCEDCTARTDGKVFANHVTHECVDTCGFGMTANNVTNNCDVASV